MCDRYKTLIPKLSAVITTGQNDKIVESALTIMESMFSFSMENALNRHRLNIGHLRKLGFHGIPECGLGFNVRKFSIFEKSRFLSEWYIDVSF